MRLPTQNKTKNKTNEKLFSEIFKKTIKVLNAEKTLEISLNFVSAKKIREINKKYRKKDKETDCISFAFNDSKKFPGENFLGEIFLCPEYIKKNTNEKSLQKAMQKTFLHSLLHLFGFDHNTDEKENEMEKLSNKILL